jgi:hypothetical protein
MDAALDEITMPTEIVAAIGEGALAYRESGILSLADGRVFSACRQYRYRLSEDSVVVEFADGPHIGTQFLSEFLADGYRVGSEWRLCLRRRHLPCNLQDSGAGGL